VPKKRPGIKIVFDQPGAGPELKKGDCVRICYNIQLNRGDFVAKSQVSDFVIGDRNLIAGFRYGLEGMRVGGERQFRAGAHLCYRDQEVASIPANALLIFTIKAVKILG
jgi:FKBP-type peptidyl-prolyl cis-trans isomerase